MARCVVFVLVKEGLCFVPPFLQGPLSTTPPTLPLCSFTGGKNPFLGICYLVVGCLCVLSAAVFAIMIRFRSRQATSRNPRPGSCHAP